MTTLVDHKTKTELALQVLRDRIRTGQFEPGQRLRLKDLTADLGMSPTPIREALRLLQADGFVDYRPHQGIVVAELSLSEVDGVLRLRRLLEPFAVELAVARADGRAQARELRAAAREAAGRGRVADADIAVSEYNVAWHWAIYDAAGSPHLREFIRRLWDAFPWRTMWGSRARAEQSAVEQHERSWTRSRRAIAEARRGEACASSHHERRDLAARRLERERSTERALPEQVAVR